MNAIKRKLLQRPIIVPTDNKAKYIEEGYLKAALEYEQKLIKQSDYFNRETITFASSITELTNLLDEYDRTLMSLMEKLSSVEKQYIETLSINSKLERENMRLSRLHY